MREEKTEHKVLGWNTVNGARRYSIQWGGFRSDVVKLHRFYVPGVDDADVVVTGVWRGMENHLLRPVALLYLNRLQEWFDWATLWDSQIELDREHKLTMEITLKVGRPYLESKLDEAYRAWLKKYPHASAESWGAYAANHVRVGHVECEIGSCEKPIVPGTTCCDEHQKFA